MIALPGGAFLVFFHVSGGKTISECWGGGPNRHLNFFETYGGKAISYACCVYIFISGKPFPADFAISG